MHRKEKKYDYRITLCRVHGHCRVPWWTNDIPQHYHVCRPSSFWKHQEFNLPFEYSGLMYMCVHHDLTSRYSSVLPRIWRVPIIWRKINLQEHLYGEGDLIQVGSGVLGSCVYVVCFVFPRCTYLNSIAQKGKIYIWNGNNLPDHKRLSNVTVRVQGGVRPFADDSRSPPRLLHLEPEVVHEVW